MIDVSNKIETLRTAVAESAVLARQETIDRVMRGETPKGEALTVARVAAILAAKKTFELIPYCHPLPLDSIAVTFESEEAKIRIRVEVKATARTGVEMEALVAASVAALAIYDMAKGIDRGAVIGETRLVEKHGGKSDFEETFLKPLAAAVLVTSDSVSAGKKPDKSGKIIVEEMKRFPVQIMHEEVIADEKEKIRKKILDWVEKKVDLILTTGGTGLGLRDVTVDVIRELVDREIPGIAEAMRSFGQKRTPYAMLSRGVAGLRGKTLIVTLPGSSRGVRESIAAVFPNVLHLFNMIRGGGHG